MMQVESRVKKNKIFMAVSMYTDGWFMLMYGKNHHNIVK